jgi:hypothetical protein
MNRKRNRRCSGLWWVLLFSILVIFPACRQPKEEDAKAPESATPFKVTVEQVQKWIDENEPLVFLDSRSPHAWDLATTKAVGAIRVPPDDVESFLSKIPRDRKIIVYCT